MQHYFAAFYMFSGQLLHAFITFNEMYIEKICDKSRVYNQPDKPITGFVKLVNKSARHLYGRQYTRMTTRLTNAAMVRPTLDYTTDHYRASKVKCVLESD